MRDTRGFRYALEPLRLQCEWELNDLALRLCDANRRAAERQSSVEALDGAHDAQCDEWRRHQGPLAVISLEMQRLRHAHLARLGRQLQRARADLVVVERDRDQLTRQVTTVRRFGDGVDRDRKRAQDEHANGMDARAMKDADDAWLARLHCRRVAR